MKRAEVVQVLINFFEEAFQEDPIGVSDWFQTAGLDANEFKKELSKVCNEWEEEK
jgi:hypothetical protein